MEESNQGFLQFLISVWQPKKTHCFHWHSWVVWSPTVAIQINSIKRDKKNTFKLYGLLNDVMHPGGDSNQVILCCHSTGCMRMFCKKSKKALTLIKKLRLESNTDSITLN